MQMIAITLVIFCLCAKRCKKENTVPGLVTAGSQSFSLAQVFRLPRNNG